MVKKKVDSRIRTLIENSVATHHRSLFIIVGDYGRDQLVNLHYILTKCHSSHAKRPNVLWCYKKDLGFTTHRQKRLRKIKKDIQRGIRQADEESPFEMFVGATDINYCYYKETDRILGQTYGMLILQDFPSITPNLLARTIETVEGGGIICILLKSLSSLKQLYAMTMDVHSRYRTETHTDVVGRFNERFILSISGCKGAIVVDDELNILPISTHINNIKPIRKYKENEENNEESDSDSENNENNGDDTTITSSEDIFVSANEKELKSLKESLKETAPIGPLLSSTRTLDQAKALLTFVEAISEKTLRSTVTLTSGRGRGKSSALGLAIAGAVAYGYSNIFVTSPSPENVKTLFEMILKGFSQLEFKNHQDYEVIHSGNPDHHKAIVRINIFHTHRQTIQYIEPQECNRLGQAELLCIDEAAAIPLNVVKNLLGNYLVFMSSTVHGYEGTGRALSLKLIKQLRNQSQLNSSISSSLSSSSSSSSRSLREITLEEPIRYSLNDPIESWLNDLLCLNCTSALPTLSSSPPHPSECELYYVDRDTLFSYHKASEAFLQRMMALYVSSHYKNSPNDLQLLSDAPAHHLFVLLSPPSSSSSSSSPSSPSLPDILCVIQVCLEGTISKNSASSSLQTGARAAGDLIPWTISQQFQNDEFATLSGLRVVRIAVHPECGRMGYGSRALELLSEYYEGKIISLDEEEDEEIVKKEKKWKEEREKELQQLKELEEKSSSSPAVPSHLLDEILSPRRHLPPLLNSLSDRPPESLHYLGTSYGLTLDLYNFWKKSGYYPLYVRLTASQLTGEHTAIMVKPLGEMRAGGDSHWLSKFYFDFTKRFTSALSYDFRDFTSTLALSVLVDNNHQNHNANTQVTSSRVSLTSSLRSLITSSTEESLDSLVTQHIDMAEKHSESSSSSSSLSSSWSDPSSSFSPITFSSLTYHLSHLDIKRLEAYASNLVDYHMIIDLLPTLSRLFFHYRFNFSLSHLQSAVLLGMGLQHKSMKAMKEEFNLEEVQVSALFNKMMRKFIQFIRLLEEKSTRREIMMDMQKNQKNNPNKNNSSSTLGKSLNISLENELSASAKSAMKSFQNKDHQWDQELKKVEERVKRGEKVTVSIPTSAVKGKKNGDEEMRGLEMMSGEGEGNQKSEKKDKKKKRREEEEEEKEEQHDNEENGDVEMNDVDDKSNKSGKSGKKKSKSKH